MSLSMTAAYISCLISILASAYTDDTDRICDQIVRASGKRAATLAEVMARPLGPVPASRRIGKAA